MLYVVATPIGNLSELSLRAIDTLKNVDLIAAEDVRHSLVLLRHYNIDTPLIKYERFSEIKAANGLICKLKEGKNIALISDAGMPLISDPGAQLIEQCIKNELEYTVISGACAAINALVLSGLSAGEFCMLGFLPDKESLRKRLTEPYLFVPGTLIFYSPPQSVAKDLSFLFSRFGARRLSVIAEITKLNERVYRGVLGDESFIKNIVLKGEFVLVIEGYKQQAEEKDAVTLTKEYMAMGLDKMDAIKRAARDKKLPKSEVYRQFEGEN